MAESSRRWPIGIIAAFVVVILVNIVFVWVAIHGRDPVVSSYQTEPR
ncbi:MAG: hypothetical protein ACOY71_13155 [Gemmatimonadota bacterium]